MNVSTRVPLNVKKIVAGLELVVDLFIFLLQKPSYLSELMQFYGIVGVYVSCHCHVTLLFPWQRCNP